ncbi:MAG: glutamate racemase [Omnitrophica WOR_2 bacterium RIFCSPHIGHO2_01_FULL_48_9]|nr:MAG: glutamate racemase [Omnitrophica WOR_2 bacterium RIFCSPHIGHO2_02_FULL_48_11]OGX33165.1 MAG: glutamate racemase [Omnitrophica WOR_2 bacterium RIFCSPHIGHO2_01_FULL_48_9]
MSNNRNYAIGVFDSGLGGLTVVKELLRLLPNEDIVYFGDTARVPYGTKSKESIIRFSKENVSILLKHKVKMIVVACNTSSSFALPVLRESFSLPILGVIKPGAKKAVETTRNRRVGIIATSATINSGEYVREIKRLNPAVKVTAQACPLFVPLVEEGWFEKDVTRDVARQYLAALKKTQVDTLILGCTHYPLLKPILKKVMGQGVMLVDSAQEVAREVKQLLEYTRQNKVVKSRPRHEFLVSDEPKHFSKLAQKFLGRAIHDAKRAGI